MWLYVALCGSMWLYVALCGYGADNGQRWGRARRAERAELWPAACCLMLPDGGCNGAPGRQRQPNFMLYSILLTVIMLIIVIDIILLRQIFVYVLYVYYLCSEFLTHNIKRNE